MTKFALPFPTFNHVLHRRPSLSARIVAARLQAQICPACGGWLLADHPECGCWCGSCRYNWLPAELAQMRLTLENRLQQPKQMPQQEVRKAA